MVVPAVAPVVALVVAPVVASHVARLVAQVHVGATLVAVGDLALVVVVVVAAVDIPVAAVVALFDVGPYPGVVVLVVFVLFVNLSGIWDICFILGDKLWQF